MEKKNIATKKLRYDIILIVSLLVFSLVLIGAFLLLRRGGAYAEIEVNGVRVAEHSLFEDGEYPLGDGSNVLVIEGGEAYMKYADCPDKVCVKRGAIKYVGQSIICLPNRVVVTVRGASSGVDLVS